jgi:predicted O-linked N-acetylglucosamine transferase (SPINDLY family)
VADSNSLLERALNQHRSGNLIEAAKGYRKVLRKEPQHANALYLLGCIEYQNGKNEAATDLLLEAITYAPREADYHNALGLALSGLQKYGDAESSFRRALQLENRPQFHANLGLLYKKQNRLPEAITAFRQSLALRPDDTEVWCELGDVLQDTGDYAAAATVYENALKLDPHLARAWCSLGCAEIERQEFVDARAAFEEAVDLQPAWLEARHNLARTLYEVGQVSAALEQFKRCAALPQQASARSRAMIAVIIPGVPEASNQEILDARRNWVEKDLHPQTIAAPAKRVRVDGDRIRIGYVSSFFQRDNWMKPVWALINRHDRDKFLVNLFSDAPASAIQHGHHPQLKDRFFNTTSLSNEGLANLIRDAEIDIVIDLNGYSNMRRLPLYTLRPAPVVLGWFNMYATSGMNCFDYLIGDEQTIPSEEEQFYSEKILRVAGSYLTFSVEYPVPPVSDPPCLSKEGVTFGSLASQYKLTNEVIAAWSQILNFTPNSSLFLKNKHLASTATQEFVRGLFAKQGVATERLLLEGPSEHYEFLQAYERIDLALDPFPYNGGTTTTEAIWQGVPVLTFAGDRWASRTSASLLRAGGLQAFVASDVESYVALAAQWGNDSKIRERLVGLRRNMRTKLSSSSLCDTATFAREMEQLYLAVHAGS